MNRPRPTPRGAARRPAAGRRLPLAAVVATVVVVLVLVVVVVNAIGGDDDTVAAGDATAEQAAVAVTGTALERFGADLPSDPAVGQPAPEVTGVAFDGSASTVGRAGQRQLLVFVAHWCPHCQAEVPRIVEWMAGGLVPEGTEVVAVVTGTDASAPNHPPSAWLADESWSGGVLLDDEAFTAGEVYGLSAYPFMVLVDADGTVAARASGELTEAQFVALLAA